MKTLDEINKSIEKFFFIYGKVNVVCSTDFYYDFEKNEIGWSFLTVERQDQTFSDFFEKELSCPICNSFIYSIFHEYGHKMTLGDFSEADWDKYQLALDGIEGINDNNKKDYEYYKLPIELAASQWAVNFIIAHYTEIVIWFETDFLPALNKLFEDDELAAFITELVEGE